MSSNSRKPSKKRGERASSDTIRQRPLAPPGHPFNRAKPEERAHPAERKVKYKRRAADEE